MKSKRATVALAGAACAIAAVLVYVLSRDSGPAHNPAERPGLVKAPPKLGRLCRAAAQSYRGEVLCPQAIPGPAHAFADPRLFVLTGCQYLIELQPGRTFGAGPVFHMFFGGRCGNFDLSGSTRWPVRLPLANGLRLVGVKPLRVGERGPGRPARPQLVRRLTVRGHDALLLGYPANPLTTVHSGHLVLVWNEGSGGYVVSGHPAEQGGAAQARAVSALARTAEALADGKS